MIAGATAMSKQQAEKECTSTAACSDSSSENSIAASSGAMMLNNASSSGPPSNFPSNMRWVPIPPVPTMSPPIFGKDGSNIVASGQQQQQDMNSSSQVVQGGGNGSTPEQSAGGAASAGSTSNTSDQPTTFYQQLNTMAPGQLSQQLQELVVSQKDPEDEQQPTSEQIGGAVVQQSVPSGETSNFITQQGEGADAEQSSVAGVAPGGCTAAAASSVEPVDTDSCTIMQGPLQLNGVVVNNTSGSSSTTSPDGGCSSTAGGLVTQQPAASDISNSSGLNLAHDQQPPALLQSSLSNNSADGGGGTSAAVPVVPMTTIAQQATAIMQSSLLTTTSSSCSYANNGYNSNTSGACSTATGAAQDTTTGGTTTQSLLQEHQIGDPNSVQNQLLMQQSASSSQLTTPLATPLQHPQHSPPQGPLMGAAGGSVDNSQLLQPLQQQQQQQQPPGGSPQLQPQGLIELNQQQGQMVNQGSTLPQQQNNRGGQPIVQQPGVLVDNCGQQQQQLIDLNNLNQQQGQQLLQQNLMLQGTTPNSAAGQQQQQLQLQQQGQFGVGVLSPTPGQMQPLDANGNPTTSQQLVQPVVDPQTGQPLDAQQQQNLLLQQQMMQQQMAQLSQQQQMQQQQLVLNQQQFQHQQLLGNNHAQQQQQQPFGGPHNMQLQGTTSTAGGNHPQQSHPQMLQQIQQQQQGTSTGAANDCGGPAQQMLQMPTGDEQPQILQMPTGEQQLIQMPTAGAGEQHQQLMQLPPDNINGAAGSLQQQVAQQQQQQHQAMMLQQQQQMGGGDQSGHQQQLGVLNTGGPQHLVDPQQQQQQQNLPGTAASSPNQGPISDLSLQQQMASTFQQQQVDQFGHTTSQQFQQQQNMAFAQQQQNLQINQQAVVPGQHLHINGQIVQQQQQNQNGGCFGADQNAGFQQSQLLSQEQQLQQQQQQALMQQQQQNLMNQQNFQDSQSQMQLMGANNTMGGGGSQQGQHHQQQHNNMGQQPDPHNMQQSNMMQFSNNNAHQQQFAQQHQTAAQQHAQSVQQQIDTMGLQFMESLFPSSTQQSPLNPPLPATTSVCSVGSSTTSGTTQHHGQQQQQQLMGAAGGHQHAQQGGNNNFVANSNGGFGGNAMQGSNLLGGHHAGNNTACSTFGQQNTTFEQQQQHFHAAHQNMLNNGQQQQQHHMQGMQQHQMGTNCSNMPTNCNLVPSNVNTPNSMHPIGNNVCSASAQHGKPPTGMMVHNNNNAGGPYDNNINNSSQMNNNSRNSNMNQRTEGKDNRNNSQAQHDHRYGSNSKYNVHSKYANSGAAFDNNNGNKYNDKYHNNSSHNRSSSATGLYQHGGPSGRDSGKDSSTFSGKKGGGNRYNDSSGGGKYGGGGGQHQSAGNHNHNQKYNDNKYEGLYDPRIGTGPGNTNSSGVGDNNYHANGSSYSNINQISGGKGTTNSSSFEHKGAGGKERHSSAGARSFRSNSTRLSSVLNTHSCNANFDTGYGGGVSGYNNAGKDSYYGSGKDQHRSSGYYENQSTGASGNSANKHNHGSSSYCGSHNSSGTTAGNMSGSAANLSEHHHAPFGMNTTSGQHDLHDNSMRDTSTSKGTNNASTSGMKGQGRDASCHNPVFTSSVNKEGSISSTKTSSFNGIIPPTFAESEVTTHFNSLDEKENFSADGSLSEKSTAMNLGGTTTATSAGRPSGNLSSVDKDNNAITTSTAADPDMMGVNFHGGEKDSNSTSTSADEQGTTAAGRTPASTTNGVTPASHEMNSVGGGEHISGTTTSSSCVNNTDNDQNVAGSSSSISNSTLHDVDQTGAPLRRSREEKGGGKMNVGSSKRQGSKSRQGNNKSLNRAGLYNSNYGTSTTNESSTTQELHEHEGSSYGNYGSSSRLYNDSNESSTWSRGSGQHHHPHWTANGESLQKNNANKYNSNTTTSSSTRAADSSGGNGDGGVSNATLMNNSGGSGSAATNRTSSAAAKMGLYNNSGNQMNNVNQHNNAENWHPSLRATRWENKNNLGYSKYSITNENSTNYNSSCGGGATSYQEQQACEQQLAHDGDATSNSHATRQIDICIDKPEDFHRDICVTDSQMMRDGSAGTTENHLQQASTNNPSPLTTTSGTSNQDSLQNTLTASQLDVGMNHLSTKPKQPELDPEAVFREAQRLKQMKSHLGGKKKENKGGKKQKKQKDVMNMNAPPLNSAATMSSSSTGNNKLTGTSSAGSSISKSVCVSTSIEQQEQLLMYNSGAGAVPASAASGSSFSTASVGQQQYQYGKNHFQQEPKLSMILRDSSSSTASFGELEQGTPAASVFTPAGGCSVTSVDVNSIASASNRHKMPDQTPAAVNYAPATTTSASMSIPEQQHLHHPSSCTSESTDAQNINKAAEALKVARKLLKQVNAKAVSTVTGEDILPNVIAKKTKKQKQQLLLTSQLLEKKTAANNFVPSGGVVVAPASSAETTAESPMNFDDAAASRMMLGARGRSLDANGYLPHQEEHNSSSVIGAGGAGAAPGAHGPKTAPRAGDLPAFSRLVQHQGDVHDAAVTSQGTGSPALGGDSAPTTTAVLSPKRSAPSTTSSGAPSPAGKQRRRPTTSGGSSAFACAGRDTVRRCGKRCGNFATTHGKCITQQVLGSNVGKNMQKAYRNSLQWCRKMKRYTTQPKLSSSTLGDSVTSASGAATSEQADGATASTATSIISPAASAMTNKASTSSSSSSADHGSSATRTSSPASTVRTTSADKTNKYSYVNIKDCCLEYPALTFRFLVAKKRQVCHFVMEKVQTMLRNLKRFYVFANSKDSLPRTFEFLVTQLVHGILLSKKGYRKVVYVRKVLEQGVSEGSGAEFQHSISGQDHDESSSNYNSGRAFSQGDNSSANSGYNHSQYQAEDHGGEVTTLQQNSSSSSHSNQHSKPVKNSSVRVSLNKKTHINLKSKQQKPSFWQRIHLPPLDLENEFECRFTADYLSRQVHWKYYVEALFSATMDTSYGNIIPDSAALSNAAKVLGEVGEDDCDHVEDKNPRARGRGAATEEMNTNYQGTTSSSDGSFSSSSTSEHSSSSSTSAGADQQHASSNGAEQDAEHAGCSSGGTSVSSSSSTTTSSSTKIINKYRPANRNSKKEHHAAASSSASRGQLSTTTAGTSTATSSSSSFSSPFGSSTATGYNSSNARQSTRFAALQARRAGLTGSAAQKWGTAGGHARGSYQNHFHQLLLNLFEYLSAPGRAFFHVAVVCVFVWMFLPWSSWRAARQHEQRSRLLNDGGAKLDHLFYTGMSNKNANLHNIRSAQQLYQSGAVFSTAGSGAVHDAFVVGQEHHQPGEQAPTGFFSSISPFRFLFGASSNERAAQRVPDWWAENAEATTVKKVNSGNAKGGRSDTVHASSWISDAAYRLAITQDWQHHWTVLDSPNKGINANGASTTAGMYGRPIGPEQFPSERIHNQQYWAQHRAASGSSAGMHTFVEPSLSSDWYEEQLKANRQGTKMTKQAQVEDRKLQRREAMHREKRMQSLKRLLSEDNKDNADIDLIGIQLYEQEMQNAKDAYDVFTSGSGPRMAILRSSSGGGPSSQQTGSAAGEHQQQQHGGGQHARTTSSSVGGGSRRDHMYHVAMGHHPSMTLHVKDKAYLRLLQDYEKSGRAEAEAAVEEHNQHFAAAQMGMSVEEYKQRLEQMRRGDEAGYAPEFVQQFHSVADRILATSNVGDPQFRHFLTIQLAQLTQRGLLSPTDVLAMIRKIVSDDMVNEEIHNYIHMTLLNKQYSQPAGLPPGISLDDSKRVRGDFIVEPMLYGYRHEGRQVWQPRFRLSYFYEPAEIDRKFRRSKIVSDSEEGEDIDEELLPDHDEEQQEVYESDHDDSTTSTTTGSIKLREVNQNENVVRDTTTTKTSFDELKQLLQQEYFENSSPGTDTPDLSRANTMEVLEKLREQAEEEAGLLSSEDEEVQENDVKVVLDAHHDEKSSSEAPAAPLNITRTTPKTRTSSTAATTSADAEKKKHDEYVHAFDVAAQEGDATSSSSPVEDHDDEESVRRRTSEVDFFYLDRFGPKNFVYPSLEELGLMSEDDIAREMALTAQYDSWNNLTLPADKATRVTGYANGISEEYKRHVEILWREGSLPKLRMLTRDGQDPENPQRFLKKVVNEADYLSLLLRYEQHFSDHVPAPNHSPEFFDEYANPDQVRAFYLHMQERIIRKINFDLRTDNHEDLPLIKKGALQNRHKRSFKAFSSGAVVNTPDDFEFDYYDDVEVGGFTSEDRSATTSEEVQLPPPLEEDAGSQRQHDTRGRNEFYSLEGTTSSPPRPRPLQAGDKEEKQKVRQHRQPNNHAVLIGSLDDRDIDSEASTSVLGYLYGELKRVVRSGLGLAEDEILNTTVNYKVASSSEQDEKTNKPRTSTSGMLKDHAAVLQDNNEDEDVYHGEHLEQTTTVQHPFWDGDDIEDADLPAIIPARGQFCHKDEEPRSRGVDLQLDGDRAGDDADANFIPVDEDVVSSTASGGAASSAKSSRATSSWTVNDSSSGSSSAPADEAEHEPTTSAGTSSTPSEDEMDNLVHQHDLQEMLAFPFNAFAKESWAAFPLDWLVENVKTTPHQPEEKEREEQMSRTSVEAPGDISDRSAARTSSPSSTSVVKPLLSSSSTNAQVGILEQSWLASFFPGQEVSAEAEQHEAQLYPAVRRRAELYAEHGFHRERYADVLKHAHVHVDARQKIAKNINSDKNFYPSFEQIYKAEVMDRHRRFLVNKGMLSKVREQLHNYYRAKDERDDVVWQRREEFGDEEELHQGETTSDPPATDRSSSTAIRDADAKLQTAMREMRMAVENPISGKLEFNPLHQQVQRSFLRNPSVHVTHDERFQPAKQFSEELLLCPLQTSSELFRLLYDRLLREMRRLGWERFEKVYGIDGEDTTKGPLIGSTPGEGGAANKYKAAAKSKRMSSNSILKRVGLAGGQVDVANRYLVHSEDNKPYLIIPVLVHGDDGTRRQDFLLIHEFTKTNFGHELLWQTPTQEWVHAYCLSEDGSAIIWDPWWEAIVKLTPLLGALRLPMPFLVHNTNTGRTEPLRVSQQSAADLAEEFRLSKQVPRSWTGPETMHDGSTTVADGEDNNYNDAPGGPDAASPVEEEHEKRRMEEKMDDVKRFVYSHLPPEVFRNNKPEAYNSNAGIMNHGINTPPPGRGAAAGERQQLPQAFGGIRVIRASDLQHAHGQHAHNYYQHHNQHYNLFGGEHQHLQNLQYAQQAGTTSSSTTAQHQMKNSNENNRHRAAVAGGGLNLVPGGGENLNLLQQLEDLQKQGLQAEGMQQSGAAAAPRGQHQRTSGSKNLHVTKTATPHVVNSLSELGNFDLSGAKLKVDWLD
ncbi:unnamed protein product [Amoebophrya sp. A120]|nr:unnamed protein product [Amoebophrya sp. A120]|eukprot:GSA120T00014814001.1